MTDKNNDTVNNLTVIWNKTGTTKQVHTIKYIARGQNRTLQRKPLFLESFKSNILTYPTKD